MTLAGAILRLVFVLVVLVLVAFGILVTGCAPPNRSPLATPRHERPQLFVYPRIGMLGRQIPMSVLVPTAPTDLLCLTVVGPDLLEQHRSCAPARLVGFSFSPSIPGRHTVVATLEHDNVRQQVASDEICVIGPEAECDPAAPEVR